MSGINTTTGAQLIRTDVWSDTVKEILEDDLIALNYVSMIEFSDGNTLHIPSVGQMVAENYTEDGEITFQSPDTGEFTFTITEYKQVATYITDKQKQDSYYTEKLLSRIPVDAARALNVAVEVDILGLSAAQTANNANVINGANHRFVASGTNEALTVLDIRRAKYALDKANVPYPGRIAIVCPEAELNLRTDTVVINQITNQPAWDDVLKGGLARGMRFVANIEGFDIYVSNYLADANETINSVTTTVGKANMFFSALPEMETFLFAWRQDPRFEFQRNIMRQRDEYVLTARYGKALYRPEALVCILSDTNNV